MAESLTAQLAFLRQKETQDHQDRSLEFLVTTSILAPTSKATPWRTPSAKRPKGGPESHIRPLDATCVAAARCAAELRRRFSSGHGSR